MLKFLICLFMFGALFVAAWPLALLALLATPFVLLACLSLKAMGFLVGGILHVVLWIFAALFAIALTVICLPLALIF